jgi:hypothetical protein
LVEHSLGKGEVTGSIPVISSRFLSSESCHSGDSNMQKAGVGRLSVALAAYAILAALVWFTISDSKIRTIPLAILGLMAVKSILWHIRKGREASQQHEGDLGEEIENSRR